MRSMAPVGMAPASAQASQMATSTRSHLSYLLASDQTRFISGRE